MMPSRTRTGLVVGCLILLMVTGATADDIRQLRLFGPPQVSPYGDGPEPGEGLFFTFEGLFWWIETPEATPIGFPNLTRNVFFGPDDSDMVVQSNTHDTGFLKNFLVEGNRYEIGRVLDRWGWFVSAYDLHDQWNTRTLDDVDVVFVDDEFGPLGLKLLEGFFFDDPDADPPTTVIRNLPVTFDDVRVTNRVDHWSVELNAMYRTRRRHHGGFFEFFGGARYMELDDTFLVSAEGGILADSNWDTRVENNIIGPQAGMRWFRQHGRWRLSAEGRLFAGINNQNIHQSGVFGTQLNPTQEVEGQPMNFDTTGYVNDAYEVEFSPGLELRLDLHYQITRALSVQVGWTGFYLDGIARASSMINYEVPTMGINLGNNRQDVFIQGVTVGFELNR